MDRRAAAGVMGMPDIEIDGVRLAVARDGVGPALVCLHAVGMAAAISRRWRNALETAST